MPIRGIRGATTTHEDSPEAILNATRSLLETIQRANPSMKTEDVASAMFTVTEDLRAAYPSQAAREMGWTHVPLICSQEIPVPGGLARCIRVLLHWNTELPPDAIRHVYQGNAAQLRPDLAVADTA
jgi:chorismate mutase